MASPALHAANRALTNDISHLNLQAALQTHQTHRSASQHLSQTHRSLARLSSPCTTPATPILRPADRKPSWDEGMIDLESLENLPESIRPRTFYPNTDRHGTSQVTAASRKSDGSSSSSSSNYRQYQRYHQHASPAPQTARETIEKLTQSSLTQSVPRKIIHSAEPQEFTARDMVALDRLRGRLRKIDGSHQKLHGNHSRRTPRN